MKDESSLEKFRNSIRIETKSPELKNGGWNIEVVFRNISGDTLTLHNIVPLGENPDKVYITGLSDHYLSRTHLFRPGYSPVNVIVPDNAWELGFSETSAGNFKLAALSRRTGW